MSGALRPTRTRDAAEAGGRTLAPRAPHRLSDHVSEGPSTMSREQECEGVECRSLQKVKEPSHEYPPRTGRRTRLSEGSPLARGRQARRPRRERERERARRLARG